MKNEMWKMFELTGNIESYLYYKSNTESEGYGKEEKSDIGEIITIE